MDPIINERLGELESELLQLRAEVRSGSQQRAVYRAVLLVVLAAALLLPQRIPKWAEGALGLLSTGGVGLLLMGGDKEGLLALLTRKI